MSELDDYDMGAAGAIAGGVGGMLKAMANRQDQNEGEEEISEKGVGGKTCTDESKDQAKATPTGQNNQGQGSEEGRDNTHSNPQHHFQGKFKGCTPLYDPDMDIDPFGNATYRSELAQPEATKDTETAPDDGQAHSTPEPPPNPKPEPKLNESTDPTPTANTGSKLVSKKGLIQKPKESSQRTFGHTKYHTKAQWELEGPDSDGETPAQFQYGKE